MFELPLGRWLVLALGAGLICYGLWNGYRSSTKWLMEWFSWLGYYSNYVQAKEIWFWDVK